MAWLWWLLAPVASTGVGAVAIWWRNPAGAGRRLHRTDAVTEHQALLRALAQRPASGATPRSGTPRTATAPQTAAQQATAQQATAQPALD
jgi:hypothetical protein